MNEPTQTLLASQPGREPTRREQQAQETRTRLIETALHLFAQKGVGSTSIKDIAREAKVAQGLLYHYFASKDDLLWGVLEAESFLLRLQEVLTQNADCPAEQVLKTVALEFYTFLQSRQARLSIVLRELQTSSRVRQMWEENIGRETALLEEFLRARVAAGELRPHTVEVTAYLVMHGVVSLYLPGNTMTINSEAAIAEMTQILVRGVLA